MKRNNFFLVELFIVVGLVLLDLLTKQLAVKYLSNDNFPLIPGVFSFTLLEGGNSGAAFGLLQGGFWIFVAITIVVIAIVIFGLRIMPPAKRYFPIHFVLVLLLAGALGNFSDRIITMIKYGYSYVIDFLYFELINFPIFNIADCYVTIAALTMLIFGIFYYKDEDFEKILGRDNDEAK